MMTFLLSFIHGARYLAMGLLLSLMLLQFSVVVIRYVLGTNFLWAQEAALAAHGAIFMLGAGATLLVGKHVAIDVLYSKCSAAMQGRITKIGFVCLLLPMMVGIFVTSWPYVLASWKIAEGSQELSGLPGLYIVKTLILAFPVLMLISGLILVSNKNSTNSHSGNDLS